MELGADTLAQVLVCKPDQIQNDSLAFVTPFGMRRRGVELGLHLGEAPPEIDRTLVRNVITAQRWLRMILDGQTFSEIAEAEGTSEGRVQDIVCLAQLAPDVLDAVASGERPAKLASDNLIKTGFPALSSEQRSQFARV